VDARAIAPQAGWYIGLNGFSTLYFLLLCVDIFVINERSTKSHELTGQMDSRFLSTLLSPVFLSLPTLVIQSRVSLTLQGLCKSCV